MPFIAGQRSAVEDLHARRLDCDELLIRWRLAGRLPSRDCLRLALSRGPTRDQSLRSLVLTQDLQAVLDELLSGPLCRLILRCTLLELRTDLLRGEEKLLELPERQEKLRRVAVFAAFMLPRQAVGATLVRFGDALLLETLIATDGSRLDH